MKLMYHGLALMQLALLQPGQQWQSTCPTHTHPCGVGWCCSACSVPADGKKSQAGVLPFSVTSASLSPCAHSMSSPYVR